MTQSTPPHPAPAPHRASASQPAEPAGQAASRLSDPGLRLWLWPLGAAILGAVAARSLFGVDPSRFPDRCLVLAGALGLPAPVVLLGTLTTPKHRRTRSFLGQPAAAIARDAVGAGWRLCAALLAAPVGFAAAAAIGPGLSDDLLRATALVGTGAVGVGLSALLLIPGAMVTIARGTPDAWRRAAGLGFGPPEVAPLLYAPALAFLLGLTPVALLSALWGASPALLPPERALAAGAVILISLALTARRRAAALAPEAHGALLTIGQAHATPFTLGEEAPEPPGWLTDEGVTARFLGRAWVRRYPASLAVSGVLALLACVGASTTPLSAALVALALTAYAGTRGRDLLREGPDLAGAAAWLGASSAAIDHAERRLSLRLTLPGLAVLALGWPTGQWLAVALGAALGASIAVAIARIPRRSVATWSGRGALLLGLVASLAGV